MTTVTSHPVSENRLQRSHVAAVFLLFFASGFGGLVYEVLWMKELGLLFGNTSYAAATTLAAFFTGIAAGGFFIGRYVSNARQPLRIYALLEAGVTVSALLYFLLLDTYHLIYMPLFEWFGPGHPLFIAAKFLLAAGVLFPPAFFMGGTLPAMSQHLVRNAATLGKTASVLYATNTFGAALGALCAGFFLPRFLGFTNAYLVAISITGTVALIAWILSRKLPSSASQIIRETASPESDHTGFSLSPGNIRNLALLSGFVTLALEVLWTRMFAQVLQNSVYTFTIILVIFLIALAIGSVLARILIQKNFNPVIVVFGLLVSGALTTGLTPTVFLSVTNEMAFFGKGLAWNDYVLNVFMAAATIMLVPGILLGSLFPYLFRISQRYATAAGSAIGDLAAINTVGAIFGSIAAGFFMLDLLGLWHSIQLLALIYLVAGLFITTRLPGGKLAAAAVPVFGVIVLLTVFDVINLPKVSIDPDKKKERLIDVIEGSAATVAVIERPTTTKIKVNNYYGIGGTGDHKNEERQAHLPLLIHPNPKSVFFLGMGTGITAGAALQHPVDRIIVAELLPEVVTLTQRHISPWLHGLYEDPRASVIVEDGRNYLLGTDDHFDVIIADLFLPWKAGTGSLYSREHFQTARSRLNPAGIYAQWLPLFQTSREDFNTIARTMLEVFPRVTLWRSKFSARVPILLLVGHTDSEPLDTSIVVKQLDMINRDVPADHSEKEIGKAAVPASDDAFLLHYAGNLTRASRLAGQGAINTDDKPRIEYNAPIAHMNRKANDGSAFIRQELIDFYQILLSTSPPGKDPYLSRLNRRQLRHIEAGLSLHRSRVLAEAGNQRSAGRAINKFKQQTAFR